MNEKEQALANMMNQATDAVNRVVSFGEQQIPEVISQMLWWEFLVSFLCFLGGLIILGAGFWGLFKAHRYFYHTPDNGIGLLRREKAAVKAKLAELAEQLTEFESDPDRQLVLHTQIHKVQRRLEDIEIKINADENLLDFAPGVLGVIVGGAIISFNYVWIQIWLVPKYYLLQHAVQLFK